MPDPVLVDTAAGTIAILEWGGDGPVVLLVHGFPDTAHTWREVGPRLAEAGFRVLAPFTRGIAPSPVPADGDYANDRIARDLTALLDALSIDKAVFVGHDFGASFCYAAAGLFPERVEKLVTVAIPHPATLRPSLSLLWGARHFVTLRLPGAPKRFAANDFAQIRVLYERWSPGFDWPDSAFRDVKAAYGSPGCTTAALAYYKALTPTPSPGLRAKIAVPALILGGKTDGVAREQDFEASRSRFTGPVDVKMLPGGHFLHLEHPEPFVEALLGALRS